MDDRPNTSAILFHIANYLGFGTVRKFTTGKVNFYRYIVEDIKGVLLLALLKIRARSSTPLKSSTM